MTVRDLLKDATSEVWITTNEDPHKDKPEIIVQSRSDYEEEDFLSDKILDSEINLIMAVNNAIYISLLWG